MNLTPLSSRKPYEGNTRKLVIAFDVGTTFSGASFAKLEPGLPPNIQGVTRFPAQHKVGGNSKIPSIIYYDSHGVVKAVGAEAVEEGFLEIAQDEGYTKVEWFKLHLRPKNLSSQIADSDLPPLPAGKSAIDIFSDFLKYLFHCTRQYIVEMNYNGESYWKSVEDNIDFVLTHPNGWEGRQQGLMRQAAVKAGLVQAKSAQERIQFVTEGEASLHYCITTGNLDAIKNTNEGMIIVDAGGGTIDLSAYRKASGDASGGWSFEEIAPIQCCMQGSIFVTRRARAYLHSRLSNTRFGNPEDVQRISEVFDATTKLGFRDSSAPYYIRFGGMRDTERTVDIRNGQMKLAGDVVAQFFKPSITAVVDAVQSQQNSTGIPIKTVILVGGYAASDWLFSNLCTELAGKGCTVFRPDGHLNKAVADGAVSYHLDRCVSVRTARFSYGIEAAIPYLPQFPDHKSREHLAYESVSGVVRLPGYYSEILAKGTTVREESEFRQDFSRTFTSIKKKNLGKIQHVILCFKGDGEPPDWISDDKTSFSTLCTVESNLWSLARQSRQKYSNVTNTLYHEIEFEVVLLLGMTELKAQVAWIENGSEKRSPATIVYNDE